MDRKIYAKTLWPYCFDILFIVIFFSSHYVFGKLPNADGETSFLLMKYSFLYWSFLPIYGVRIASFVAIIRKFRKPNNLEQKIVKYSCFLFLLLFIPGFLGSDIWAYAHGYKSCFRVDRKMPVYLYVPKEKECPEPPTLDQLIGVDPNPYMDMYRSQ
jgi:hypothetical protein